MLCQHCILRNLRKNKDIVITILDQKIYDNSIEQVISGTSKFEKVNEDPTVK